MSRFGGALESIDEEYMMQTESFLVKGKEKVLSLLRNEWIVAVRARPFAPGQYVLDTITRQQFERMRRTVLIAAFFTSVEKNDDKIGFPRDFAGYLANHEELLITDIGSGLRVYHY